MTDLIAIATASKDEMFRLRVQAATAVLGVPFDPSQVMHVASRVDLTGGVEGVEDAAIIAALTPADADPTQEGGG